jgi:hypothetical protein
MAKRQVDNGMKVLLVSEGEHEASGALESLVMRTLPRIVSCTWDRVSNNRIETQHSKGQGFLKRAVRWMREARKRGFDALVLVVDEDGNRRRVQEMNEAQNEDRITGTFPRALGVAIRTFDAWMLADERALSSILDAVIPTQAAPEDLTDPKAACADLLGASSCGLSQREFYAKVAKIADLLRLEQRCPKGFGVFAARLKKL